MARYKDYCYEQTELIPVSFDRQVLPGTFEYALSYVIDHELDLSVFEARYHNDDTGAPAYDPAVLLKIVLYGYSRGVISSRDIALLCEQNVVCMALSANTRPHFTTIADFVSSMQEEIVPLFRDVLAVCASEGLIAKEMFAIDGCKLSSNCSKEWSGTRADFEKKVGKLEKQIRFLIGKHRMMDARDLGSEEKDKERQAIQRLRDKVRKLKRWLGDNDDKPGKAGRIKQSNVTDNESAKMATSHGVVQGYNGQAAVDSKHQVVVHAEVFGEGQEHDLLRPMVEGVRTEFQEVGEGEDVFEETTLVADAGYHTEKNMEMLFEENIDAYVADNKFRRRDPRFAEQKRYKRSTDRHHTTRGKKWFQPSDFKVDKERGKLICPAGNELFVGTREFVDSKGRRGTRYVGWKTKCRGCPLRKKCLRSPHSQYRTVVIYDKSSFAKLQNYTKRMIEKFDTPRGRYMYSRRLGTAEPVFGNLRQAIGLDHFTLRGKNKVRVQWKLFAMVHNLFKISRYAPSFA